ncbi:5-formyltetrahydrofolate cyclo-ligase [Paratractidigestivibacter sp.]|uniref:5-formyltetrahydrofolate cyclo-ligase n=1 Tax=Paratractidigestivibacter sp. TaxID=2847316 RepID=UPI002ABDEBF8|nr:5-formyltetrahydrofolate cyclo-ligase [Paratractidigestivibacter sp.]
MASSYGTDADKSSLRGNYLAARRRIDPATKAALDANILKNLEGFDIYDGAHLVLAYVSYNNEVDTRSVIESAFAAGKRVAVPRVTARKHSMSFFEIESMDDLVEGYKDILEPRADITAPLGTKDFCGSVCLVPGLVFDAQGYRIGYGGGYYDRFLPFYPGDKIALARSSQMSSNPLPADSCDVPVDFIVTDTTVWTCR